LIALAVALAIFLIIRAGRNKKLREKAEAEEQARINAVAAANNAPVPPAPEPKQPGITDQVLNAVGSLFQDTQPRQDVMNADPTYVMASRMNDSIEDAWLSNSKTQLWNDLASRQDDFVGHVVNWYNGQFGRGKTLRQNLEAEWTGDTRAILNKLSSIGL
jgi:hypothetical protein